MRVVLMLRAKMIAIKSALKACKARGFVEFICTEELSTEEVMNALHAEGIKNGYWNDNGLIAIPIDRDEAYDWDGSDGGAD